MYGRGEPRSTHCSPEVTVQILCAPSFLCVYFSSYPALQRDIQPLQAGSLLSSVRTIIKVTQSLFCDWNGAFRQAVRRSGVTFAASAAGSGGWFLSVTHPLHIVMVSAVLRYQGTRHACGIPTLILFPMLRVWTVMF